jgi:hypothetical protein
MSGGLSDSRQVSARIVRGDGVSLTQPPFDGGFLFA